MYLLGTVPESHPTLRYFVFVRMVVLCDLCYSVFIQLLGKASALSGLPLADRESQNKSAHIYEQFLAVNKATKWICHAGIHLEM